MMRTAALIIALALPAAAQDRAATLADIRQQLTVLEVELQSLRRELSTTGTAMGGGAVADGGPLARLDAIEAEVRRLTARSEELQFRVDRVVQDGTNRIDDLKFRLTELEGGDLSAIPSTPPLGGGGPQPSTPIPPPAASEPELAVGEQADFDAAEKLVQEGTPADAYDALTAFVESYPRSPMAAQAQLYRGNALAMLGNHSQAGRAYLEAYTLAEIPEPTLAADALTRLGQTLAELDQVAEACVTLAQVGARFPDAPAAATAQAALAGLSCP